MSSSYPCPPRSSAFSVRDTPASGRAVFADAPLEENTTLLITSNVLSPLAHLILRPYRKEACAQCFAYDRGREWKSRDVVTGTAFCSEQCQQIWKSNHDELTYEASSAVEAYAKALLKKQRDGGIEEDNENDRRPKAGVTDSQHTEASWKNIELTASMLRDARYSSKPNKIQRAALSKAKELRPDPDILSYSLSGVIAAYRSQQIANVADTFEARILLPSLFTLAEDSAVFLHTPTSTSLLLDYTSSYLVLLAILPQQLLKLVTAELIINLASRASHNAFSIRPEGHTDGEQSGEFLGWGVWPEASFFNHSCRPNVRKQRKGRLWSFSVESNETTGVVRANQQLCITYLGGDEKELNVTERRQKLSEQWGFRCQCDRCVQEAGE